MKEVFIVKKMINNQAAAGGNSPDFKSNLSFSQPDEQPPDHWFSHPGSGLPGIYKKINKKGEKDET
jgi:hypothetical protein